jgi:hypothetical protein
MSLIYGYGRRAAARDHSGRSPLDRWCAVRHSGSLGAQPARPSILMFHVPNIRLRAKGCRSGSLGAQPTRPLVGRSGSLGAQPTRPLACSKTFGITRGTARSTIGWYTGSLGAQPTRPLVGIPLPAARDHSGRSPLDHWLVYGITRGTAHSTVSKILLATARDHSGHSPLDHWLVYGITRGAAHSTVGWGTEVRHSGSLGAQPARPLVGIRDHSGHSPLDHYSPLDRTTV